MPFPLSLTPWTLHWRVAGVEQAIPNLANGFRLSQPLAKPESLAFDLHGEEQTLAFLVENETDIVAYRGGTRYFRGRITTLDDSVDPDGSVTSVAAVAYGQLLQTRMVPAPGANFIQVEQAEIVWALIQATQALTSGDLGITEGTLTSNVLRDRSYAEGVPMIGKLIDDLGACLDGFDWWIDELLRLQVRAPRRERDQGHVLAYPGNLRSLKRKSNAAKFRNVVRVSGAASTVPVMVTDLPDARGRFEIAQGSPEVVLQATLTEKADGLLAEMSDPRATYTVELEQGVFGVQFTSQPGDIMRVQCAVGRLAIDEDCRIIEQSFSIDNDGAEKVQMSLVAEP